jgi:hypothetical protein
MKLVRFNGGHVGLVDDPRGYHDIWDKPTA